MGVDLDVLPRSLETPSNARIRGSLVNRNADALRLPRLHLAVVPVPSGSDTRSASAADTRA